MAVAVPAGAWDYRPAGAWRQGELNVYWFDVDQGDGTAAARGATAQQEGGANEDGGETG